jgi:threonine dehydratase
VIELSEIEAARARVADVAARTPLVRLYAAEVPADTEIYLKLEALQPIGSFKIRGATNAVALAPESERARGLVTASAGNMAQGVAWAARELGLTATIAVPEHAPRAKLDAIERLGGRVVKLPYDDWWQAIVTSRVEGVDGLFVHPVQDEGVMAGNGTIGLEILDDLPDPDAVVIPYGGGGLTVGIASAIRAVKPDTKIYTAEPATGAALVAALVCRRCRQPPRARHHVAARAPARRRRVRGADRRGRRGRPDVGRAGASHRRGRRRARHCGCSGRPRGPRQGGVHRVGWQHRPGQAGRHPSGR